MCKTKIYFLTLVLIVLIFFINIKGYAMEISDKFSIGGVLSGAYQYQDLSDATGFDHTGRGAIIVQPELSFTPSEKDEIFVKLGFSGGHLNLGRRPFAPICCQNEMGPSSGGKPSSDHYCGYHRTSHLFYDS